MQSILLITVPAKKIKGAAGQCYGDGDDDGVVRCEQTFTPLAAVTITKYFKL